MDGIFKKIPGIIEYKKVQLISGGISNKNYRIISANSRDLDQLVTLFPKPETWWKIQKEEFIVNLYSKKNIPSAKILGTGYLGSEGHTYGYILREFIQGEDLDVFLRDKVPDPEELRRLLTQLGDILGTLHSIRVNNFGLLKEDLASSFDIGKQPPTPNWQEYIDGLMLRRDYLSKKIYKNRVYGNVSGADVQDIFKSSYALYKEHRVSLEKVNQPFLIHYDMLFKNIIVSHKTQLARWQIVAIIDNEWVSAGDPDVDLIQIENAAYFSPNKDMLSQYWDSFTEAYSRRKPVPKHINSKRIIYHMMRLLFYLIEVYGTSQPEMVIGNVKNVENIEANYVFLNQLIASNKVDFSLFE